MSQYDLISQNSCLREATTACEEFQRHLLLFLQSKHPENHLLAQDLRIIEEEVDGAETDEGRTRRVEAEGRVLSLVVRTRDIFGDGDWRASRKVCHVVMLRSNSIRAIDRLDFLLASST